MTIPYPDPNKTYVPDHVLRVDPLVLTIEEACALGIAIHVVKNTGDEPIQKGDRVVVDLEKMECHKMPS